MLQSYLKNIFEIANRGDAREESFYGALEGLFSGIAHAKKLTKIQITTLPKKTEAGNPDFRIWGGTQRIVGYIEAKAPTVDNLNEIEDSEQLQRYRHTFPNLILTNFFEFRLYRNGNLIDKVLAGRPFIVHKLKTMPPIENQDEFFKLIETFFGFSLPAIHDPRNLAVELAKRTRFLKDEVVAEAAEQEKSEHGFILGFYEAFKKYLIRGLSKEDFADLYAQTITYGLFAARTRSKNGFNRKLAYDNIPQTIGILRDVFQFISLGKVPSQMEWIIDDIADVLATTDVNNILHQYYREGKGKDPIVHFYETFLAEYDPEIREKRGVYFTPEAVVSYIVRSLHYLLKDRFARSAGLANDSVTVLDPAAGTLTFIAEAANQAVKEFVSQYGEGGKEKFIKEHILANFYAFELMMAPYAIGHLKMSFLMEELGFQLQQDDRFKLYLTNTLEMEELAQTELPGMASLSEESHLAGRVKKTQPVLVILGNPPYSGHSANASEKYVITNDKKGKKKKKKIKTWIGKLIEDYKLVDGKPLGEKNPKWLQNDYVKLIRFAQWKIEQAGEGVLGFITDHSYLDNPTFRGMRRSLMKSFNEIYVLDLHGNSLKKEKSPDGSKDENVFDIQQGVAIALFIKTKSGEQKGKVYHSEIWGTRDKKYKWLLKNDIAATKWRKLTPKPEFHLFIPRDEKFLTHYEKSLKINDIFVMNNVGIVTARDELTIKWTPREVNVAVLNFSKMNPELARSAYNLGKDANDWKVALAQKDLIESGLDRKKIVPILYRPFDIRYTYYTGKSSGFHCRPRSEVMRHMMTGSNLGLILPKRVETKMPWAHILCTDQIVDHVAVSLKTIDYLFPLYVYPNAGKKDLFSQLEEQQGRRANINEKVFSALLKTYKSKITPEDIFCYIYAVLYSNAYRSKYAELLKIDFPRVPFTQDHKLFKKMAQYGHRLVELHLLKSSKLEQPIAKFQGKSGDKVETLKYHEDQARVFINESQFFERIEENVWNYQIGGYQVCSKWLKDRTGKTLSLDEIKHYCKIVSATHQTIELQKSIDEKYNAIEKQIIEF